MRPAVDRRPAPGPEQAAPDEIDARGEPVHAVLPDVFPVGQAAPSAAGGARGGATAGGWRAFACGWSLAAASRCGAGWRCGHVVWFARDLPRPETALDAARRPGLSLQDRGGHVFATYGDVVGDPLRLRDMPRWLPEAAVAVEDRRFYSHSGVDPVGIARAVWVNLRAGRLVQGGSTIDAAGGQEPVPDQRPDASAQGAGADADALAGAQLHQAGDPRDLAEPGLSRLRRLGRGRGRAACISASRRAS